MSAGGMMTLVFGGFISAHFAQFMNIISSPPHFSTTTKTIHPKSEECLSEAMNRRVYDLKNDEELKAAYWEATRGGAAGATKVWTHPNSYFIAHLLLFTS